MVRIMSDSASPEAPDVRGRELARRSRRLYLIIVLFTLVLPLCLVLSLIWSSDKSNSDWVALPIVVSAGYLLILLIVVLSVRSGAKMVRVTSEVLPDAYLVCQATDPRWSPVVVLLVVQASGLSLCEGRGANLRPVWELAWADIAAADVSEYKYRFDTRPAVRVICRDGRTKFLLLVDRKRFKNDLMDVPRRVAALINEQAGHGGARR